MIYFNHTNDDWDKLGKFLRVDKFFLLGKNEKLEFKNLRGVSVGKESGSKKISWHFYERQDFTSLGETSAFFFFFFTDFTDFLFLLLSNPACLLLLTLKAGAGRGFK